MKPLILIKHSMPEVVKSVSANEWRLSRAGKLRAQRLAEPLKKYALEHLVSSMEPKALETAQILAQVLKVSVSTLPRLHEHDRRNVPYAAREEFERAVAEFFATPEQLVFGNETAQEAARRFDGAVALALHQYSYGTLGIVAHGTVISLFVSRLTGLDGFALWRELGLPAFVVLNLEEKTLIELVNLA